MTETIDHAVTLADLTGRTGLDVLDHLEQQVTIPIVSGVQALYAHGGGRVLGNLDKRQHYEHHDEDGALERVRTLMTGDGWRELSA